MNEQEVRKYWRIFSEDILRGDDGYFVYWPITNKGFHSSHSLRLIAELLDLANYTWDQSVKEYFS